MLYGSETWCLRETKKAILKRSERAMVRSMSGVKLVDRKGVWRADGDLGFEGNVGENSKGEWSKMIWTCD